MVDGNNQVRRRTLFGVAAAAVTAGAAGCTGGAGGPAGAANDGIVTLSLPSGATYAENWNPFSTADQGPGLQWFYEQLVRVRLSDGTVAPWLATSWEFSEDGKVVTFSLQPNVTWSDGTPLTADDVVYSLGLVLSNPELNLGGATYTAVDKVDDLTLTVTWDEPAYTRIIDVYYPRVIVPKHIYEAVDPLTYLDKSPIGSGPVTLESFSPQQVTMAIRDDYWGGEFAMEKIRWVVSSQASVQGLIVNGSLDVTNNIPNPKQFLEVDPDHNQYFLQADGSVSAIIFNTERAPFDDPHLRRAIAHAVDIGEIRDLGLARAPRTFPVASISGLNSAVFQGIIPEEYLDRADVGDPEKAKAALEAGGYTVEDGRLVKDGATIPLEFQVNVGAATAKNIGTILTQQVNKNLGLEVTLATLPTDLYSEARRTGDFSMIFDAYGTGRGVYWTYRMFGDELYAPLGEEALGNVGRFRDEEFDEALRQYTATDDEETLATLAVQLQDRFVDQMPAVPLMSTGGELAINASQWTGWPTDDNLEHVPSPGIGPDFILTMKNLKPAG